MVRCHRDECHFFHKERRAVTKKRFVFLK
jgi:hypothetical protein